MSLFRLRIQIQIQIQIQTIIPQSLCEFLKCNYKYNDDNHGNDYFDNEDNCMVVRQYALHLASHYKHIDAPDVIAVCLMYIPFMS